MTKAKRQAILDGNLDEELPRPDKKNKVTLHDFEDRYTKICAVAGDLQYRISRNQETLKELNLEMLYLNQEAEKLKNKEKNE